jgi:hypothetical protein
MARAFVVLLFLSACPRSPPAPTCAALPPLINHARDDSLSEDVRLDAYHDALDVASKAKCAEQPDLTKEYDVFVDELTAICLIQEIKGDKTQVRPRVKFGSLRRAIADVDGPRRSEREAHATDCARRLAEDSCGVDRTAGDWAECVKAQTDRLLH